MSRATDLGWRRSLFAHGWWTIGDTKIIDKKKPDGEGVPEGALARSQTDA